MNQSFAIDAQTCHNKLREKHGAPPLELCKKLCRASEKYAKTLARIGVIEASNDANFGENIISIKSEEKFK